VGISEQPPKGSRCKKLRKRKMSVLVLMSTISESEQDKNKKEAITLNLNRKELPSLRRKVRFPIS
jgi:hypothetical protein